MSNLPSSSEPITCPCGSKKTYAQCCGQWHAGSQYLHSPDAQALMRSRYSAFVLDLRPYLLDTWHPDTRPALIEAPEIGLEWLGLKISQFAQQDATHATVSFTARYRLQGHTHRMSELSYFEQINGYWYYVNGMVIH